MASGARMRLSNAKRQSKKRRGMSSESPQYMHTITANRRLNSGSLDTGDFTGILDHRTTPFRWSKNTTNSRRYQPTPYDSFEISFRNKPWFVSTQCASSTAGTGAISCATANANAALPSKLNPHRLIAVPMSLPASTRTPRDSPPNYTPTAPRHWRETRCCLRHSSKPNRGSPDRFPPRNRRSRASNTPLW